MGTGFGGEYRTSDSNENHRCHANSPPVQKILAMMDSGPRMAGKRREGRRSIT